MNLYYYINKIEPKRFSTYNYCYSLIHETSMRFGIRDKKYDKTILKNEEFKVGLLSFSVSPILLDAEFQSKNVSSIKSFTPLSLKKFLYNKLKVPDVLLSGNHANIEKWREEKALELTQKIRPDLLK